MSSMWSKIVLAGAFLLIQSGATNALSCDSDCAFTVSVLDVAGVQCVPSAPCSGMYDASGLVQGVGACPDGASCALLPASAIMGCAKAGRSDLVYVNSDGSLTRNGQTVTLADATKTDTTSVTQNSPTTTPSPASTAPTSTSAPATSNSPASKASSDSGQVYKTDGDSDKTTSIDKNSEDKNNSSNNSSSSATLNSSHSWASDSGSGFNHTIQQGNSSANQQSFNPGSILSDDSKEASTKSSSTVGITTVIGVVVGCLAVVAIAVGARLLRKGKDAGLATPEPIDDYGGMTPKEDVLLL